MGGCRKALYIFRWIGGGYNQVYAFTKKEALAEIKKRFSSDGTGPKLEPDLATMRRLTEYAEKAYWKNLELWD